jgi:hypothetical protein
MKFGIHYETNCPKVIRNDILDGALTSTINQIYVKSVEVLDDEIAKEIVRVARDTGITDVVLLDKNNIKVALEKASPKPLEHNKCPVCNAILLSRSSYCDVCGQRVKPYSEEVLR